MGSEGFEPSDEVGPVTFEINRIFLNRSINKVLVLDSKQTETDSVWVFY